MLHSRDLLGDDAAALQSRHKLIIGRSSISLYDTATSNKAQEVVQRHGVPSVDLLCLVSILQKFEIPSIISMTTLHARYSPWLAV